MEEGSPGRGVSAPSCPGGEPVKDQGRGQARGTLQCSHLCFGVWAGHVLPDARRAFRTQGKGRMLAVWVDSRSGEVTRIVPGRMHRVIKARRAEGQVWARGHRALAAAWTLELRAGEVLQAWGPGPHSPFLPLAAESRGEEGGWGQLHVHCPMDRS